MKTFLTWLRCLFTGHLWETSSHGNAAVAVELAIAKYELCQKEGCQDNPLEEGSVHCKRCGKYWGYRDLNTGKIV